MPATAGSPDTLVLILLVVSSLALVSVFGARNQAQAMDSAAVMLGVAGLIACIALVVRPLEGLAGVSRLAMAWGAFLAWGLVSTVFSGRVWASLVGEVTGLLGWLTLAAFTAVALAAASRPLAVRRLLAVAAPVIVFAQTAATLVQLAMSANPRGSLPNSTYLGEAVLLLLPFTLNEDSGGFDLRRRDRYALAASAVVVLAAAGSRVAAAVALAWFLWVLVGRSGLARRVRIAASIALIVTVTAGALVFARAEVLGSAGIETLGARPQMWRVAALAVAKRPLVGYGPDGFVAGGATVTTPDYAREHAVLVFRPGAVDPHNLLVWVAVSTGLVGLALFVWAFLELALVWRARARSGEEVASAAWAVCGVGAVLLTAPLALQVVPLLALVVGASVGGVRDQTPLARRTPARVAGAGAVVALGVASVLLAANTGTRLTLEEHGPQVSSARTGLAQAATDLWRFDPHLAHLASLHWGWAAAGDPRVAAGQPDLRAIESAVAMDARDPFVAFERARTLRFYGAPAADVEAAFLATFKRWSLFPLARAEYAVFLAQAGRVDEAREQIAIAELVGDDDPDRHRAVATARELIEAVR